MIPVRRIVVWVLSTLSALVLLVGYHTSTSAAMPEAATAPAVSSASRSSTQSPAGSGGSSGGTDDNSTSDSAGSSGSSSGGTTVTGDVVQTQWGPVQVQISVRSGSITDVSVLQYPNGNPRDAEINSYALPVLVDETTSAQSADIDMVSGATVTSTGYEQSLQSAIDKAGL